MTDHSSPLVLAWDVTDNLIQPTSDFLHGWILAALLLGVGVFFTIRTRCVQLRLFPRMWATVLGRDDDTQHPGISSFQAFATGMASRVGTGNIVGVAIALTLGGPGAIFWMWVVAFVGMATGFVEATLAQIFKERYNGDATFRGGPAYYIRAGLGSRRFAAMFAIIVIFVFGFAFNMVQANTIADALEQGHSIPPWVTAIALVLLLAPLLLRGISAIARFAGTWMPIVAGVYILVALAVALLNLPAVPGVLADIVTSAFGLNEAVAGTGAGIFAALMNGTRRGLFSNEAGMGSAPNMAATASVTHPVQQGLIQSLGVFIDTIVICTGTAIMILVSGAWDVSLIGSQQGAALTTAAVTTEFGSWATILMTVIVFLFAFTSIFGNYSYAEVNLHYLNVSERGTRRLRVVILAAVALGALLTLPAAWGLADIAMWMMAMTNLVAIVLLSRWFFGALKDYEAMTAGGQRVSRFVGHNNPHLPGDVPGDVWGVKDPDRH